MTSVSFHVPVAIILLGGGLLACFLGYRLLRALLALYGFIGGVVVATLFVEGLETWVAILVTVGGGLVGAAVAVVAYPAGVAILGAAWKKEARYYQQARVENAFFRYKSIIGETLRARTSGGQMVESLVACQVLNRMTHLGSPESYRVGRRFVKRGGRRCAKSITHQRLELVRCHYNFVRPHRALRFGRETRTPAMQARLVSRRLALSDIFTGRLVTLRVFVAVVETAAGGLPTHSWSYEQRAAA